LALAEPVLIIKVGLVVIHHLMQSQLLVVVGAHTTLVLVDLVGLVEDLAEDRPLAVLAVVGLPDKAMQVVVGQPI
jgi:hypothetical protein